MSLIKYHGCMPISKHYDENYNDDIRMIPIVLYWFQEIVENYGPVDRAYTRQAECEMLLGHYQASETAWSFHCGNPAVSNPSQ